MPNCPAGEPAEGGRDLPTCLPAPLPPTFGNATNCFEENKLWLNFLSAHTHTRWARISTRNHLYPFASAWRHFGRPPLSCATNGFQCFGSAFASRPFTTRSRLMTQYLFLFSTSATSSSVENWPLTTSIRFLMTSSEQSTSNRPPMTTGSLLGFT